MFYFFPGNFHRDEPFLLPGISGLSIQTESAQGFCCLFYFYFFTVLWWKIFLNMCQGNSEKSNGCPYLLRICTIHGTNESVSRESLCRTRCLLIYQQTSARQNTVTILKLVSFERLAGKDFFERGTQAEAHCERNLNRQL